MRSFSIHRRYLIQPSESRLSIPVSQLRQPLTDRYAHGYVQTPSPLQHPLYMPRRAARPHLHAIRLSLSPLLCILSSLWLRIVSPRFSLTWLLLFRHPPPSSTHIRGLLSRARTSSPSVSALQPEPFVPNFLPLSAISRFLNVALSLWRLRSQFQNRRNRKAKRLEAIANDEKARVIAPIPKRLVKITTCAPSDLMKPRKSAQGRTIRNLPRRAAPTHLAEPSTPRSLSPSLAPSLYRSRSSTGSATSDKTDATESTVLTDLTDFRDVPGFQHPLLSDKWLTLPFDERLPTLDFTPPTPVNKVFDVTLGAERDASPFEWLEGYDLGTLFDSTQGKEPGGESEPMDLSDLEAEGELDMSLLFGDLFKSDDSSTYSPRSTTPEERNSFTATYPSLHAQKSAMESTSSFPDHPTHDDHPKRPLLARNQRIISPNLLLPSSSSEFNTPSNVPLDSPGWSFASPTEMLSSGQTPHDSHDKRDWISGLLLFDPDSPISPGDLFCDAAPI